jgi:hypothetical protein
MAVPDDVHSVIFTDGLVGLGGGRTFRVDQDQFRQVTMDELLPRLSIC